MPDVINGYEIIAPFRTAGGGRCMWTFARKDAKEYFIKKYTTPRFPVDGAPGSAATNAYRRKVAEGFENHQKEIMEALDGRTATGGNLVSAVCFFRDGPIYYKVTEKVDVSSPVPGYIAQLESMKAKTIVLLTIVNSLKILHDVNIVHGDLKPDNILIKNNGTAHVAKLIDFDDSYFNGKPPGSDSLSTAEDLVGTPEYYSPEAARYIKEDPSVKPQDLTVKSDIFTLGILFHEYWVGYKPRTSSAHNYVYSAVNAGEKPSLAIPGSRLRTNFPGTSTSSSAAPATPEGRLHALVQSMLSRDYNDRPTIGKVQTELQAVRDMADGKTPPSVSGSSTADGKTSPPMSGSSTTGKIIISRGLNTDKS
jgi:eukaryotic-like serine/threonine-protein kinase